MAGIDHLVVDAADPVTAASFYAAFGVDKYVQIRAGQPTPGFRDFTVSLVVSQPGTVDAFFASGVGAGAHPLKPPKKSFWGYGGVLRAPDGVVWKVATSAKKDSEPVGRTVDSVVLLIGVADVKATKDFYAGHGLTVNRSFGAKYAEFEPSGGAIALALYGRKALAKDAGTPLADSVGPHGITVVGDAGAFTDPDGFVWETA